MSNKLKQIIAFGFFIIYFSLFSFSDFPKIHSLLLDLTQLLPGQLTQMPEIRTVNIDTKLESNKRPFSFEAIDEILKKLSLSSPKNIVLMISPKEITTNEDDRSKILNLFNDYSNLYLFSPYTNGPLGGFKADKIFEKYPRHFSMPLTKDTLFGSKDSKIRRAILMYENKGEEPFMSQLREMGLSKIKSDQFTNYFELWDSRQIYIKTRKLGSYGFETVDQYEKNSSTNATVLVGSFDEFSIHTSPSIFDYLQNLNKDNFEKYFFPIVESAANIIEAYSTQNYIKTVRINDLLIFPVLFILVLYSHIEIKKKLIFCFATIPIIILSVLAVYLASSFYIDAAKSIVSIFVLQYIGMPIYLYLNFKNTESKKFELINQTRLDAFLTVAEKIAHDIRSPLSSIQLLTSTLHSDNPEIKPMINESVKRINDIAQDILNASKIEISSSVKTIESVDLLNTVQNIIAEKQVLNIKIVYKILTNSDAASVLANRIEVQRVISNIIDNSIKALKDENAPKIEISIVNTNETYTLEISDNGKGIDTNLLSMLGKFRIDKGDTDKASNGIGVMHSKRVIEKLGGNFEINNNEKKSGANVKISLKKFIASN